MFQSDPTQTGVTSGPSLLVSVTADHIANGQPCDHNLCPIVQAVQAFFPDHYVTVGATQIIITPLTDPKAPRHAFTQSTLVQEWVRAFDNHQQPGPIHIYLDYTNHTAHLAATNHQE